MLKVLFAGTPDVAVPSLKLLAQDTEHFEVVAVLTRPDAPTGRGRKLVANPVKQAALELGLPVIESDPSEETFVSELAATGAQAAAVVAYVPGGTVRMSRKNLFGDVSDKRFRGMAGLSQIFSTFGGQNSTQ